MFQAYNWIISLELLIIKESFEIKILSYRILKDVLLLLLFLVGSINNGCFYLLGVKSLWMMYSFYLILII